MSGPTDRQIDAAMATLDGRGLGGRNGMRAALQAAFEAADVSADDVREALGDVIEAVLAEGDFHSRSGRALSGRGIAEVVCDEFEVRPHGPITDAEVEAAWLAWDAVSVDDDPNGWLSIRAALEAARQERR